MFSQPTSGGGGWLSPRDHHGNLILVTEVHEADKHYDDRRKKEMVRLTIDYVDLDGDGRLRERVYVTAPGMTNRINRNGPTLGRVGTLKLAQGDMWVINPFEEGVDDVKAQAWLDKNKAKPFGQPDNRAGHQKSLKDSVDRRMGGQSEAANMQASKTPMTVDQMRAASRPASAGFGDEPPF